MPIHCVHDLRHYLRDQRRQGWYQPKALQMLLSHARIETTLKYYTHMNENDLHEAAAKINAGCKSVANADHKQAKRT